MRIFDSDWMSLYIQDKGVLYLGQKNKDEVLHHHQQ